MDMNTPIFRFPGFSDPWESHPFRAVAGLKNKALSPSPDSRLSCIELEHLESGTGAILGHADFSLSRTAKTRFCRGDVLFGKLRPNLRKFARPDFDGVCSKEIWVFDGILADNGFLFQLVQTPRFQKAVLTTSGTRMPRASWKSLSSVPFPIPSRTEQLLIADFLRTADNEILAQKQLILSLKQQQRELTEALFRQRLSSEGLRILPLSSILTERLEYAKKGEAYPHLSLTKDGIVHKSPRYNRDFLVKNPDKPYKITRLNDICYNPANLKFGVICRNRLEDGIFSPIYGVFSVNPGFIPGFVEFLVTRPSFLSQALRYQEGTVYERMSVKPDHLLSLSVPVPPLSVQEEIAGLADLAGRQIREETCVLEKLAEQKKGLLETMFF